MNSIANPRRTDAGWIAGLLGDRRAATLAATLILAILLITFRPFQPAPPPGSGSGGDIVNQLGFGSLAIVAMFSLMTLAEPKRLAALLSPWWLLLTGFLLLSVSNALDPQSALRAAAFTLIAMLSVVAVVTLPRTGDDYAAVLSGAGLLVIGLCYLGVLLYPSVAIHSADSIEAQHAGFWRGSFSHKNVAGPVMACLSFAGLFVWRHGWRKLGAFIALAALWFVANTGSKTTAGLVPAAMLIVLTPRALGLPFLLPVFFVAAFVGTALATLGIVFLDPLKSLVATHMPDLTYTGRTEIWNFAGESIAARPWSGYGFESFWGTPYMFNVEAAFDSDWDVSGSVHGHNGYLDLAIAMGLPALAIAIPALLLAPLRDYMRTPPLKENVYLADFFAMILLFTLLNAFLESFFFRRADPVWLFTIFAVFGLRLNARFPIGARAAARRH